jgi:hypothetical protein
VRARQTHGGATAVAPVRSGLIASASADIATAVARYASAAAARGRLARLVAEIDSAIAACEAAHLEGLRHAPRSLGQDGDRARDLARSVLGVAVVDRIEDRECRDTSRVSDVMECLWALQDVALDHMYPGRRRLSHDDEVHEAMGLL